MAKIDDIRLYLGDPYSITIVDKEAVIYRDLGNGYSFELSGVHGGNDIYSLYVWKLHPVKEIVAIYHKVHSGPDLKDFLGHCAFKYRNLQESIQVEREELAK